MFGLAGGILGAIVWTTFVYFSGIESRCLALLIGALAGVGIRLSMRDRQSFGGGMLAGVIAIGAICAGKIAIAGFSMAQLREMMTRDPYMIGAIAEQTLEERQQAGEDFSEWYSLHNLEVADSPKDFYPSEIWTHAVKQWKAMPDLEKDAARIQAASNFDSQLPSYFIVVFISSFKWADILWAVLAVVAAFFVACTRHDQSFDRLLSDPFGAVSECCRKKAA
ncbi:MAG: hypothetical protein H6812_03160 [Phycisphaeraceae bacterium]|nr:hypothetical protein [Phycisphaerales bacterium]MCB9842240.1 hypothetical protein [Phycisphaeraceae bacterium]